MKQALKSTAGLGLFLTVILIFNWLPARNLSSEEKPGKALRAGQEKAGSWWMKQTAMSPDGRLGSLKSKKWWKNALGLKAGESFIIQEKGEAKDRMMIRAESYSHKDGYLVQALVWIIDDDGDGSLASGGDFNQDCYLYDLNRDGLVDIMVDYADEDGDGQADFMEIRFYEGGYLARVWGGYDYDKIGEIFKFTSPLDLMAGNFLENLSGDKLYFKNVFNPLTGTFWPANTCPLASYDLNQDGLSDLVIGSQVLPAGEKGDFIKPLSGWSKELMDPVIRSLEVSFDLSGENNQEKVFNYNFGLLQAGGVAFDLESWRNFSLLRRPPQEVFFIPRENLKELIYSYEPEVAGFSWREYSDDSSGRAASREENQGEGIGWLPERVRLPGTSSCVQKWNVRREVAGQLNGPVEFYYSELDQKIHLFGSEEGWCQIGNMAGCPALGEIQYFDADHDGFYDRLEVYLVNSARPVLTVAPAKLEARKIPFDLKKLQDYYQTEVLPRAFERDNRLLQAMKGLYDFEPPAGLLEEMERAAGSEKRYLLDVYCLLYFINLRDHFLAQANQVLFRPGPGTSQGDLDPFQVRSPREVGSSLRSDTAWQLAGLLSRLDKAWSQVDLESVIQVLQEIKKLKL
ncbi:MAG TPA: hypothetical protein PLP57_01185 [Candidatus Saccharicenans sp.]|nr:hypothetical protein [Candidatus Saccharicenans sp.]